MINLLLALAILIILEYLQKKCFIIVKHKLREIYSEDVILDIEKSNKSTMLISIINASFNKVNNFNKRKAINTFIYLIVGMIFLYCSSKWFNSLVEIIFFTILLLLICSFFMELKTIEIKKILKGESLYIKINIIYFILYKYIALILYLLIIKIPLK